MGIMTQSSYEDNPIFIIIMYGRLGNLLFDYALLLRLRTEYPEHQGYLYRDKNASAKTGYPSDLINSFSIPSSDFASEELIAYVVTLPPSCVFYIWEKDFSCRQSIVLSDFPVTVCMGYWQSESFFEDIKPLVRNVFQFNSSLLNRQTRIISEKILAECAIGVHIRRGDYIEPHYIAMYGHICTYDYYMQALRLITNKIEGDYFIYFFSDDPEWVNLNNPFSNSMVVNWNQGDESWQDMYLMSLCNHNVIANSTFSWWGAWLNQHEDKIVVAPYRCFNTLWSPDIHPEEWLTIYPKGYLKNEFVTLIEKNKILIDRNGLFYGKMGVVIFLFHYALIHQDSFYKYIALNLMDKVFGLLSTQVPFDYADGMTGIGVGVEYLCQNGFVEREKNIILDRLDIYFDQVISQSWQKIVLQNGLLGLIRYYRFRIIGGFSSDEKMNSLNLKKLILILNKKKEYWGEYYIDVVSELYELYLLNIHPDLVRDLLMFSFSDQSDDFLKIVQLASGVSSKRVCNVQFGNEPGLKGLAGKELLILSPVSQLYWTKLL